MFLREEIKENRGWGGEGRYGSVTCSERGGGGVNDMLTENVSEVYR